MYRVAVKERTSSFSPLSPPASPRAFKNRGRTRRAYRKTTEGQKVLIRTIRYSTVVEDTIGSETLRFRPYDWLLIWKAELSSFSFLSFLCQGGEKDDPAFEDRRTDKLVSSSYTYIHNTQYTYTVATKCDQTTGPGRRDRNYYKEKSKHQPASEKAGTEGCDADWFHSINDANELGQESRKAV